MYELGGVFDVIISEQTTINCRVTVIWIQPLGNSFCHLEWLLLSCAKPLSQLEHCNAGQNICLQYGSWQEVWILNKKICPVMFRGMPNWREHFHYWLSSTISCLSCLVNLLLQSTEHSARNSHSSSYMQSIKYLFRTCLYLSPELETPFCRHKMIVFRWTVHHQDILNSSSRRVCISNVPVPLHRKFQFRRDSSNWQEHSTWKIFTLICRK